MQVIYETFAVDRGGHAAGRALRALHQDDAIILEIETACGTQRATLSVAEALELGRALVLLAR
jgi:hypothetical protein